jgi:NAD(P)-dependent dehydrogenase (short-subunit alcohol dehydrogenase family)
MAANPMDLTASTVLVTGASSGIGRETAILLSSLGARVVLTGRNQGRLEETAASLSGQGHRVEPFDLSRSEEISDWLRSLTAQTGPLNGLVHSAGIHITAPLRIMTPQAIEGMLKTNVLSAILLARGFCRKGCHAADSSIVFLSSIAALAGQPAISVYGASKAALMGLAKSLALEWAPLRIRVNCIAPAWVRTEMTERSEEELSPERFQEIEKTHPLGLGRPRDVANAVAFLLADTGRWITGTTLVVDGGYSAH